MNGWHCTSTPTDPHILQRRDVMAETVRPWGALAIGGNACSHQTVHFSWENAGCRSISIFWGIYPRLDMDYWIITDLFHALLVHFGPRSPFFIPSTVWLENQNISSLKIQTWQSAPNRQDVPIGSNQRCQWRETLWQLSKGRPRKNRAISNRWGL